MNKNNEPYFPVDAGYPWGNMQYAGITKRDYFAAMAMQGLCAYSCQGGDWKEIAHTSYKIADAMIEASK
jgi:hypothetical protein